MPSSTSLNSTRALPCKSTKRSKSLSGKVQAATSLTTGNSSAQVLSNSTLKPSLVASLLKVAEQILSWSALENSQVPIKALAESPRVVDCVAVCAQAGAEADTANAQAINRIAPVSYTHLT